MDSLVIHLDEEKNRLTEKLSDHYSENVITLEEYERLVEYINKIETKKEIAIVEGLIQSYNTNAVNEAPSPGYVSAYKKHSGKEHVAVFSWRTTTVNPINGKCGKFVSIFGAHRIIVDSLPPGRSILKVETLFGLTEIVVSRNIKIINKTDTVFSGFFLPDEPEPDFSNAELPELLIKGDIVFGNLTIIRK